MPLPPPIPSPATRPAKTDLASVFHSVWHGIWLSATSSPWSMAVFTLAVIGVAVSMFRHMRWLPLTASGRDPLRRFVGSERAAILKWAGNRCEFHAWVFGRCRETKNLHVDHVHPHSRGGSTTIGNSQVLCSRHNKAKAARIPYNWQLRRLERHRAGYFPLGVSGKVLRRETRRPPIGTTSIRSGRTDA